MASTRNMGLDYLRSLAILIVLFNHALIGFFFGTSRIKFEGFIASLSASTVISIEWLFVLSGFLIGAMMIRSFEKNESWFSCAKDFWLRRWFRTIPNYYLFVLVNLLLVYWGLAEGKFEFKHLVFSQNLAWVETTPHFFGEAWSLALDEWFYVLMPIIIGFLLFLPMSRKATFITASCILIVFPTMGRIFHAPPVEFFQWDAEIRRITVYHLDATGWGVLAASVNKWYPLWWRSLVGRKALVGVFSTCIGLLLVIGLLHPGWMTPVLYRLSNSFSITLIAGGTFLVMPWLTSLRISWGFMDWVVEKLSMFSYSIYLVHFPMIFLFKHFIFIDQRTPSVVLLLVVAAWFGLVMVSSGLIFHWFEKPIANLRDSFTKRVDASPF